MKLCPKCNTSMTGIEYPYGNRNRYDGVSEWFCEECKLRLGRWSGNVLKDHDQELPFGGKP